MGDDMMSVTVTRTGSSIGGDKRTCLPFRLEKPCGCGGKLLLDLNDDCLDYPHWGVEYDGAVTMGEE